MKNNNNYDKGDTHLNEDIKIDWSDTRFVKYLYTVEVVEEYWIGSAYVIRTKTKNTASTNGTLGFCSCDTFHTYPLTEKGKAPCKHLWVCRDCMDIRKELRREYQKEAMTRRRKELDKAIGENIRATEDDQNSLLTNEEFVKKIIKKRRYEQKTY